jgi:uracil-DNA glycosylase family 4
MVAAPTPSERLLVQGSILDCTACELHAQCTAPVPFSGPSPATIAVLGEAPGEQEDIQGRPFVGPAGQLIRRLLREVAGVDPESCAWFNVASCWPRGTPSPEHIAACAGNRERQLAHLSPTWLLVLGSVALQALRPELTITRGRGRPFLYNDVVTMACYHPSAALRNRMMENPLRDDLRKFGGMVRSGREHWWAFIPEKCARCLDFVVRYDETGIGFCRTHDPARRPVKVPKTTMLPARVEPQAMFPVEAAVQRRKDPT